MTGFSSLPLAEDDRTDSSRFKGVSRILGPRWAHLPTLTVGLLGVQIFWSVEMSYASPYLISLGLSKSNMAIVFVAGPLSGLIMQPLIGVLADNSTSRWGRRRPYMIIGTVLCMFSMLLLGFTRPVASIFTGWDNATNDILTIWLAVLAIYLIDFSINAVQAVDRALLVDTLPSSDQASGNAWAARMLGVGSVVGFFVGNMDLPRLFPVFGKNQLQVLTVIVSFLLLAGHVLMAALVKERVLIQTNGPDGKSNKKTFIQEIKDLWTNALSLPRVIRQIFVIQFFAWVAWFPILFYTTMYVGDLHKRTVPLPATRELNNALDAEATRLGSRALFYSSLLSLAVNLILPAFVPEAAQGGSGRGRAKSTGVVGVRIGRDIRDGERERWWKRLCRVPVALQIHLASLWAVSHAVFAGCMLATLFTESVFGASFLITITGFSWAITQWAPFSLLAEAILTEPAPGGDTGSIRLADTRTERRESTDQGERDMFLVGEEDESEDDGELVDRNEGADERRRVMGNSGAQLSRLDISAPTDEDEDEDFGRNPDGGLSAKAGIILGIHNVFIVIPQFLVTGISAIIFAIFDSDKSVLEAPHPGSATPQNNGTNLVAMAVQNATQSVRTFVLRQSDGDDELAQSGGQSNSIVYIFRLGGVSAAIAFVLCWRLARELRRR